MSEEVSIVGGGLGGLTLANALHLRGVRVAVYEGDRAPESRTQGGLLDLDENGGQRALRDVGLHDAFLALIRSGEDAKRVMDMRGVILLDREGDPASARPEVDRGELRRLLLNALPRGVVRWDRKVASVRVAAPGRHVLTFLDGATVETELLVGADGAWSRVRPLLTDVQPAFTGTCFLELHFPAGDPRAAEAAPIVGRGTLMALAPGRGILAHRNADGGIQGYVAVNRSEEWLTNDARTAMAKVATLFDGWAPPLRALIPCDGMPVIRPIHALPPSFTWRRAPGVTLLGDAAHLMSPFAGQGANLAMLDGVELARALALHPKASEALAAYEARLFARSHPIARVSADNLASFFGSSSPRSVVEMLSVSPVGV